ncbi:MULTISPECIES: Dyp-type peroxidase [unclassified Sphingomonas]|uniref:Dyp-type peroxidase n=1 Tax=unclassified Sphingomonas TaxID=196159 RepID=UPI000928E06D|nr:MULTISPECIES: Dyp-type peroxidase [unclassified Sphingomonas]MBN8848607.1 Dyp-type peroxidase [Sphingomonas sp.]OJV34802.1 MAG: peroxidase [Sphingomonas sp. 67-36]
MPTPESQPVTARLSRSAIFLVATIDGDKDSVGVIRGFLADLSGIVRAVGFRDLDGGLTCVTGIGSAAWDRLFGAPRPKELHAFREIDGVHHAPSTPGDLLFHIRAQQMDQCFELAAQIMVRIGSVVTIVDETHGFKYFDDRDLLGFVDGTENPVGQECIDAAVVGEEDPDFAGGSYVIVQKYLHDLPKWEKVPVEQQEGIIGRKKLSDIEIMDDLKLPYAHNVLNVIQDEDGNQLDIVRDNMPFGTIGKGEYGTYFIGYARSPSRTERMLDNMFIGNPPGNYDRILDFSRAVTGSLFFIPTSTFLDDVTPGAPPAAGSSGDRAGEDDATGDAPVSPTPGSLNIGSLK